MYKGWREPKVLRISLKAQFLPAAHLLNVGWMIKNYKYTKNNIKGSDFNILRVGLIKSPVKGGSYE